MAAKTDRSDAHDGPIAKLLAYILMTVSSGLLILIALITVDQMATRVLGMKSFLPFLPH